MTATRTASETKSNETLIFAICAFLLTAFLFFIDEGYYNFRWMTNIGSWIVFLVYALPMFAGQVLFYNIVLRKYRGPGKTLLSVVVGAVVGILVVIGLIFAN